MSGKRYLASEDVMNEVLADFIGYPVIVVLKDGSSYRGTLLPAFLDDYQIQDTDGQFVADFDRQDVVMLEDDE